MRTKNILKLSLCVMVCALLFITIAASSRSFFGQAPQVKGDMTNEPGEYRTFANNPFGLTFMYPSHWDVAMEPASAVDSSLFTVKVTGKNFETVAIKVFDKPADVADFIKNNVGEYSTSGVKDLETVRSVIAGQDGYSWPLKDQGRVKGGTLVFSNSKYLFTLNFTATTNSDISTIDDLIHTLWVGGSGPTDLSFDLENIEYPDASVMYVTTCCTGYTDPTNNGYPCCSPPGNCTWYCEYKISGADSFPTYGDAYMWMYFARYSTTKTYSTGGTIPKAGAIAVFDTNYGSVGHVAYVSSIGSNGSITVSEEGCPNVCPRTAIYTTTDIYQKLAGYIYVSGTPTSTAKSCSGSSVGATTYIDDFNFSNVYNFYTYGPGRRYNDNNGWGWGMEGYDGNGYNNHYHWTHTRSTQVCYGMWKFTVTNEGAYELQAYVPGIHSTANNVRYNVYWWKGTANGYTYSNGINQGLSGNKKTFQKIVNPDRTDGYWYFKTATTYYIYLYDNYGGTSGYEMGLDAIKVIKK